VEPTGHDVTKVRELIDYLMGGPPPTNSPGPEQQRSQQPRDTDKADDVAERTETEGEIAP
jgi:hypothetical protein